MKFRSTHIKLITALLFLAMTLIAPVAQNCHVAYHVDNMDIAGDTVSEACALCSLEFPAFEDCNSNPVISTVERKACVYVPSIVGNLCNNPIKSLVIRGPPEA
ncbi:MAG: hypothetical protein II852_00545 [Bacteroidales bacterium]|nr:hypothetical protein [Bacteroidales bacterium]